MADPDPTLPRPDRRRGLESVVRMYLSRRRPAPAEQFPAEECAPESDHPRERRPGADGRLAPAEPEAGPDDLPPHDPLEDASEPGEETLPPLRLGSEAERAEAAFRLEEALLEGSGAGSVEAPGGASGGTAADGGAGLASGPGGAQDEQPGAIVVDFGVDSTERTSHWAPEIRSAPISSRLPESAFEFEEDLDGERLGSAIEEGPDEDAEGETLRIDRLDPEQVSSVSLEGVEGLKGTVAPEASYDARVSADQASGAVAEPVAGGSWLELSGAGADELEIELVDDEEDSSDAATPRADQLDRRGPRTVLLIGATPLRLRRILLEALAAPVASEGRGVLLLESALPLDDASAMLEVVLDRGSPILRRNLGVPARDLLLFTPSERRALFDRLSSDERRSALVIIDLELPESILGPRLQFLVDDVVVALTSNETSLYEAYRALRGLADRRPDITLHAVPAARTAEEARSLLGRFQAIAHEFLKMPVKDGGWLALPDSSVRGSRGLETRLSASLVQVLRRTPERSASSRAYVDGDDRPFFDHLSDWFGPLVES